MNIETIIANNYMLVHEAYTILKLLGFIFIIIGLVVYIKISINNVREEVNEKLESLNMKQD